MKQRIFYSAVALFTKKVFYSEGLLESALNKMPSTYVLNEFQVLMACLRGTNGLAIMYDACIFSKYSLEA